MKKIYLLWITVLLLNLLTSCESNTSQSILTTNEEVTTNNMPEEKGTIIDEETVNEDIDIFYEWQCETDITEDSDGNLTIVYNLSDGPFKHSFTEQPSFRKEWYDMFDGNGGLLYEFVDYNFDGFMDIRTQQTGAYVNQYYNIRIWNNETKEFELNIEFMDLPNLIVDVDKSEIFSVNYDRGCGNYTIHKIEESKLILLASIEVIFNENDGSTKSVEKIGDLESVEVKSNDDLNSIWTGYKVDIY